MLACPTVDRWYSETAQTFPIVVSTGSSSRWQLICCWFYVAYHFSFVGGDVGVRGVDG